MATLLGATALLAFAGLADSANAAVNHHRTRAHQAAPSAAGTESNTSTLGNNPAKQYQTRKMDDNAVTNGTLTQSGNNPAKRYQARHASENATEQQTLMTNGNNPAKKAPGASAETTGAGGNSRR